MRDLAAAADPDDLTDAIEAGTPLVHADPRTLRRTKIVATAGPACIEPASLREMLSAGVDVVRLNLSHGSLAEHLDRLAAVREAADEIGRVVGVLADLPGPKVRSGSFVTGNGAHLMPGSLVSLVPGNETSSAERIEVDYETLLEDLAPGDRIVFGDGAITSVVVSVDDERAVVEVLTGGRLVGRPGVHLPATRLRLRTPTSEDLVLARAMAEAGVDYLAVSFVRAASDMIQVREAVSDVAKPPLLVAKIETGQAAEDLAAILEVSDAAMVARGDLGIDCDLADVPHIQKQIIRSCVEAGVPVITATQMLETMITAPSPTRAEVSDVANAVFDGTDAVMLSGETAVGHDPALVVRTMSDICLRAELQAAYRQWASRLGRVQRDSPGEWRSRITKAVTHAAWQAAEDMGASAIVCYTRSGSTARAIARFRPMARLVAASPDPQTIRCMALSWGVMPIEVADKETVEDMVWVAVEGAASAGMVAPGDVTVVLAGTGTQRNRPVDLVRIVEIDPDGHHG